MQFKFELLLLKLLYKKTFLNKTLFRDNMLDRDQIFVLFFWIHIAHISQDLMALKMPSYERKAKGWRDNTVGRTLAFTQLISNIPYNPLSLPAVKPEHRARRKT